MTKQWDKINKIKNKPNRIRQNKQINRQTEKEPTKRTRNTYRDKHVLHLFPPIKTQRYNI